MNPIPDSRTPARWLALAMLPLLGIKLYLAARLDLYSDEVFYWLASTRLALAYSDLPFMTSLLAGLGATLDPGNPLAVRALFLLLGSGVPLLVYWIALPITGRTRAWESALLAVCLPLGGFLGLLAVPDVPLLIFGLLSLGCFERAVRTDSAGYWAGTGVAVALGLATHYRFILYPVAVVLYLLAFKPAGTLWRRPGLWLAIGIGALGLVPVIWFNLTHNLASASFYLVERHPWTFQPAGLLHLGKQSALVTPPLYALLGVALWQMLGQARRGDSNAALLSSVALVNLLVYLLLAPWTDASSTSIHWPLSGYFPLLIFAPAALSSLFQWVRLRYGMSVARTVRLAIPVLGYCGSLVALLAVGSQAFQGPLQALLGTGVLSNKMAGWREFAAHTDSLLQREYPDQSPLLVTDNYYTAAQLRFAGIGTEVYTIDNDKAVRDGRRLQLALWKMDAAALTEAADRPILLVTEDSTLTVPDTELVMSTVCRVVGDLYYLSGLSLYEGDKRFSYYRSAGIVDRFTSSAYESHSCPYPAWAWLETPTPGSALSGSVPVTGWAFKEDLGIESVELMLDGTMITPLPYGIARADVVTVMNVNSDPNAPRLGFSAQLDTRSLRNGTYTLSLRLRDMRGVESAYGSRSVTINNE